MAGPGTFWSIIRRSKTTSSTVAHGSRPISKIFQGQLQLDYNLYFNCGQAPSEAHGVYADPRVISPFSNWRLSAGSPAIGAGQPQGFTGYSGEGIDVSFDADGNGRSSSWNIGAY